MSGKNELLRESIEQNSESFIATSDIRTPVNILSNNSMNVTGWHFTASVTAARKIFRVEF